MKVTRHSFVSDELLLAQNGKYRMDYRYRQFQYLAEALEVACVLQRKAPPDDVGRQPLRHAAVP
jgi:hypothetical protein